MHGFKRDPEVEAFQSQELGSCSANPDSAL